MLVRVRLEARFESGIPKKKTFFPDSTPTESVVSLVMSFEPTR